MKRNLTLLFFLGIVYTYAQRQNPEFGSITIDELQMNSCSFDSAASAVILFDIGYCSLDESLNLVFKRHVRIKFFTKGALERWATKEMYIDREDQGISKLKGATYNLENGSIVTSPLEDNSIFKSRYDKFRNQLKFTLPNAKEGSVIEYSYVLSSRSSLIPSWVFQFDIPNQYSQYTVRIPRSFTFRKDIQGLLPIDDREVKNDGDVETFIMKNVPAFTIEPYLSSPEDFISKLDFYISQIAIPGRTAVRLTRTWPGINQSYYNDVDFWGLIRSNTLKGFAEEITAGLTTPEEKLNAIYNYVKGNVEWNKFIDKIPDRPFKKVLEVKEGSTSEINIMMLSLLDKVGIEVCPVLISNRNNGRIKDWIPGDWQFNDVIGMAVINGKKLLLDATDPYLPITSLPKRCLNGYGMAIKKDGPEWVPLTTSKSKSFASIELRLDETGALAGKLVITNDGHYAADARRAFKELDETEYRAKSLIGDWEFSNSNYDDFNATPTKETHEVLLSNSAQVSDSLIYFNPMLVKKIEENPLRSKERLYPIDFGYPTEETVLCKFTIPENYSVDTAPTSKIIVMPDNTARYVYNVQNIGNIISVTSIFSINKSVFSNEEYLKLREFYDQVVAKQAENIVLKKKN